VKEARPETAPLFGMSISGMYEKHVGPVEVYPSPVNAAVYPDTCYRTLHRPFARRVAWRGSPRSTFQIPMACASFFPFQLSFNSGNEVLSRHSLRNSTGIYHFFPRL
jgi:hypothetical protein